MQDGQLVDASHRLLAELQERSKCKDDQMGVLREFIKEWAVRRGKELPDFVAEESKFDADKARLWFTQSLEENESGGGSVKVGRGGKKPRIQPGAGSSRGGEGK